MEETVRAVGHEHVRARHESTFELTTDQFLTPAGDCIIGIEADRAPADFDAEFVRACRDPTATILASIEVEGSVCRLIGRGHADLSFESHRSLVGRTSEYVDERTVLVDADMAAGDLDRDLVSALTDGAAIELTLEVAP